MPTTLLLPLLVASCVLSAVAIVCAAVSLAYGLELARTVRGQALPTWESTLTVGGASTFSDSGSIAPPLVSTPPQCEPVASARFVQGAVRPAATLPTASHRTENHPPTGGA